MIFPLIYASNNQTVNRLLVANGESSVESTFEARKERDRERDGRQWY